MKEYAVRGKVLKADTTEVTIYREYPYSYLTRDLPGNQTTLSDETLINKVLDMLMMEIDPTNYIANVKELLDKATEALAETKKTQDTIQGALMEVNNSVLSLFDSVETLNEKVGIHSEEETEEHVEVESDTDGSEH